SVRCWRPTSPRRSSGCATGALWSTSELRRRHSWAPPSRSNRRARIASAPVAPLLVQKFGGTSVADPDRIREVAEHAVRTRRRGNDVVLVVSAMGKETDQLLRLAGDVSRSQ